MSDGYRCTKFADLPGGKSHFGKVRDNQCTHDAKWWYRLDRDCHWTPRCGRHALMPGNTKRERLPISESPPPA